VPVGRTSNSPEIIGLFGRTAEAAVPVKGGRLWCGAPELVCFGSALLALASGSPNEQDDVLAVSDGIPLLVRWLDPSK
jgi:hypothetical protein